MEILIIIWLIVLTVLVPFYKRGIQGRQGERGPTGGSDYTRYERDSISHYDVQEIALKMVDDPEYMTKLIAKLNSYQLTKGNEV